mmetsp:Transcript_11099/g.21542  ORF Transcript_11099/g.21542 Transcript_11099/m.21542 type:complete len:251 (-) Transcript_11099:265-1017(-)
MQRASWNIVSMACSARTSAVSFRVQSILSLHARAASLVAGKDQGVSSMRRPAPLVGLRRPFHSNRPANGLFDGLKDQWNSTKDAAMKKQQDDMFRKQVAQLLTVEKYTMEAFFQGIKKAGEEAGLNGWKQHVPGVKSNDQYKQMMKMLTVMESIPPELRADPDRIKATEKARIARDSGGKVTVADVNGVLKQYQELSMLHKWLRKRAAAGKNIPQSMADMASMALEPDSGFSKTAAMAKMGGRKRGTRMA